MGEAMRTAVFEATRLTVSTTKYVAKVASDCRKPDGLTVLGRDEVTGFLHPLPIDRLWGMGPCTRARLKAGGLDTIGDVAAMSRRHRSTTSNDGTAPSALTFMYWRMVSTTVQ